MENKIQVSVIVPVYNVAPYLRDCLDSLLSQGFSEGEYEVIVVDDGSTDSSPAIIQEYAGKHSCVKYIRQNNAGVSAARNTGMDHAVGEYIAFADGDDFLTAGVLKRLCEEARKRSADTLVYGHTEVAEDAHFCITEAGNDFVVTNNTTGIAKSAYVVWNALYKRTLISDNSLYFPVGMKYGEDTFFSGAVSVFLNPARQWFCTSSVYCYRQRTGSAIYTKAEREITQRIKDTIDTIDAWDVFLKQHSADLGEKQKDHIQTRRYLLSAAACLDTLRSTEGDPFAIIEELRKRKVYPYPFIKYLLSPPRNVANFIKLFLNIPVFFKLLARTELLKGK